MIESEDVLGVMTDTFHLSSIYRVNDRSIDNPGKTLHIFFIAGNPGTLHFYTSFLQKLGIELLEKKLLLLSNMSEKIEYRRKKGVKK